MKSSKYNFIYKQDDNLYIYNSLTNSFAKINEYLENLINNIEKEAIDNNEELELLQPLLKNGFIIEDTKDELAEIVLRNRLGRYTNSATSFGLTIAPTLLCNFKCTYCFECPSPERMSDETVEGINNFVLKNLKGKKSFGVCWYGGEPLLELGTIQKLTDKFKRICSAMDVHYEADIISNGYLMSRETAKILTKDLGVRFWQVTLDGIAEIHDKRRPTLSGKPTFQTILNNIIESYSYFDKVSIRINVDKTNHANVTQLLDVLEQNNLKDKLSVYLGMVQGFGNVCKSVYSDCFNESEFAKIETKIYTELFNRGFSISFKNNLMTSYCGADKINSYVIDPQGRLAKCWNDIGIPEESLGTVFDEALNNKYARWIAYDPILDMECRECNLLPLCMGGCPHDALIKNSRKCKTIKYNLIEMLKLHKQARST